MLRRVILVSLFVICAAPIARSAPKLDTAKIDAALGRKGSSTGGLYVVDFFRPNLTVTLEGVRLAPESVDSFVTFLQTGDQAEMMGEVCALQGEVTAAVGKLRAGGVEITGIHNHFLRESPRLMFIHFMARGRAADLARTFRAALAVTSTPLAAVPPVRQVTATPAWAGTVGNVLGFKEDAQYSSDYGGLTVGVPHAGFAPSPMLSYWFVNYMFFQEAPGGKIAATGDLATTSSELNPVLSVLTAQGFQIFGVHNHMIDENPRLFFVHFWKIGAPAELARGLKAALAVVHTQ
ncbi:MAG: DUF1259 domain-containing protein [Acidobacteria bacterium]|nr:MAG: DUF1259 domain-containing protein [Acidobacteriota bacterium]